MTFSRMHLGMLGIVSIFTGMISPVVRNATTVLPFPLTDIQIPAYIVFPMLAIICVLLSVRLWLWVRILTFCLFILLGYLFVLSINGEVKSTTGMLVPMLSWGWIFLIIGSVLLISSISGKDIEKDDTSISDHWIGWLGAASILALTGLIIYISYTPSINKIHTGRILENVLGTGSTQTYSGITRSNSFQSIDKLVFDRKRDSLNFFVSRGTTMISIPSGVIFDRVPYTITTIGDTTYTISAEGLITTNSGTKIGTAILPQEADGAILFYSSGILTSMDADGIHIFSGQYTTIENIILTKEGSHAIWKSKTGTGYTIYKDGEPQEKQQGEIVSIMTSSDGKSIMTLVRETDGSQYIMKNGLKIEKIGTGYIEGTLRMNGTDSIYAIERYGTIELIHNGVILDRKFDEIREIFLDRDSSGYEYFGRPLGGQNYCLYTRYKGNLCGLSGYMNPRQSPDGLSVIYAGLKDGAWGIYRNASPIIRNTGYPNRDDVSRDYVFFDITNPSYYLFIRGDNNGYQLYKKGAWLNGTWKDVGLDTSFGYDNKVIMSVQDDTGWRVIEF